MRHYHHPPHRKARPPRFTSAAPCRDAGQVVTKEGKKGASFGAFVVFCRARLSSQLRGSSLSLEQRLPCRSPSLEVGLFSLIRQVSRVVTSAGRVQFLILFCSFTDSGALGETSAQLETPICGFVGKRWAKGNPRRLKRLALPCGFRDREICRA